LKNKGNTTDLKLSGIFLEDWKEKYLKKKVRNGGHVSTIFVSFFGETSVGMIRAVNVGRCITFLQCMLRANSE
jgi:hypothetical protein